MMRHHWRRFLLFLFFILLIGYNLRTALPGMIVYGARGAADFSIFYTGATILRHGLSPRLYDLAVQAHFQSPFYRLQPLPFNHLAFELLLFLPFAALPFSTAFWAWNAVNLALLAGFSRLIAPELKSLPQPVAPFIFMAGLAFFPVIATLMGGQDSILLLLIFGGVYRLLRLEKNLLAGFLMAAALIKFPVLVPFLVPFFRRQWEFLSGFLAGAITALGISIAMTGFSGFVGYLQLLRLLAIHPEVGYINLRLMPMARGFLQTVLPQLPLARTIILGCLALALLTLTTRWFRKAGENGFDLWFALNIVVALALSPHLYRHDCTLLLLALLLAWNSYLSPFCGLRLGAEKSSKREVAKTASLAVLSLVFFATPLYQLLDDRGMTSLMFIPLLFLAGTIVFALPARQSRSEAGL